MKRQVWKMQDVPKTLEAEWLRMAELIEKIGLASFDEKASRDLLVRIASNIHKAANFDVFDRIQRVKGGARFFHLLGVMCFEYGQWKASAAFFTKALLLNPAYTDAAIWFSRLLFLMDRSDQAKDIAAMTLQKNSGHSLLESIVCCACGDLYKKDNKYADAEINYRVAEVKYCGLGYPFNQRLVTLAKLKGIEVPLNARRPECYITNVQMGLNGRFTHTLMEYFALRMYAERSAATVTTREWFGRYLFEGMDDPLQVGLPESYHGDVNIVRSVISGEQVEAPINCNFAENLRYSLLGVEFRRQLFKERKHYSALLKPRPFFFEPFKALEQLIRERGKTLVVLHIRRTDMSVLYPDRYVPEQAYIDWLDGFWNELEEPVLYVASDELRKVLPAFEAYKPVSCMDASKDLKGFEFFLDFHILMQGHILGLSHSGFSQLGASLNLQARKYALMDMKSGIVEDQSLEQIMGIG